MQTLAEHVQAHDVSEPGHEDIVYVDRGYDFTTTVIQSVEFTLDGESTPVDTTNLEYYNFIMQSVNRCEDTTVN